MAAVDIYGSTISDSGVTTGQLDVINTYYLQAAQNLLPPGPAWTRAEDAELTQLMLALSEEFRRVELRAADLIEEIDPRTTTELIDDWERVYGLPGECGAPDTLEGRRLALHAKMLGHGDPSRANFIEIAAALGYTITITEYLETFNCTSPCNAALYARKWFYVWDITTPSGDNDTLLQCVFEHLAPLHTLVRFNFT